LWSFSSWFFQKLHGCGLLLLGQNLKAMVFFFMVFSKAPKVVVFFFLVFFSQTQWLWSSSSWSKPQSHRLVLHGFFQSSQSYAFFILGFFPNLHGHGLLLPG
jgi:hypothetical protein